MIDTTTALAEWTVTGLNHHSETILFRLPHHRQPDCLSCSFARRTAPSTSFYGWPTPSSSSSPPTRCSSFENIRLPSTHPPVSITISRPPVPWKIHSPLSLGLPPKPKESIKEKGRRKALELPQVHAVRKRELVT